MVEQNRMVCTSRMRLLFDGAARRTALDKDFGVPLQERANLGMWLGTE